MYEDNDLIVVFFRSIIGFFIGIFLYLFVGWGIGCLLPRKEKIEQHEIYSLIDNSSISSSKYLIDEILTYRYVVNTEKGKKIKTISNENVYIKECNCNPIIKIHSMGLEKDWYYYFANDFFIDHEYYVEFFVPENSIIAEYNIDLQ